MFPYARQSGNGPIAASQTARTVIETSIGGVGASFAFEARASVAAPFARPGQIETRVLTRRQLSSSAVLVPAPSHVSRRRRPSSSRTVSTKTNARWGFPKLCASRRAV